MRKIFISSTFRDMQAERDAMHTTVVPQLRTMAQAYGEDVEICDLRWGVNTGDLDSEAGSRKVLSVCLDEIDKCKPFMLIILGERYGWIPEPELLRSTASRKNYQLEEMEKSVTALEIEYGTLNDPEVLKHSVFMFREPMPEADGDYQSEGEDYAKRLNALKERIHKLAGERVFTYRLGWDNVKGVPTELENFTRIVTEQLRILLEQEWQENAKLHENRKEEKRHWGFADAKAEQFAGRAELLLECGKKLETERGILLITGEAGSGKSTLWSKLVSDYHARGWNVYPFVCGNTGRSMSAMDIIKQWIFYVERLLEIEHFEEEEKSGIKNTFRDSLQDMSESANKTEEDWKGRLRDVLAMYCAKEDFPQLLLAADGLDQLNRDELAENFEFMPVYKGEKVHFLLSCLKDYNRRQYDGDCIMVHAMTQQERIEVLHGMLSYQRKGLDQIVINEIMKKNGADNPLYLSLLMQRLAMMDRDDFAVIAEYGNDMQAINRYQTELIRHAPESAEEMACLLIRETGERVNQELVKKAAEYIAVSRQGLRESDLQALLEKEGISWSSLDFSRTVHYMPMLFTERDNGRIDFTHRIIRSGLRMGLDKEGMERRIFTYLKELPGEDELRSSEMAYYCHVLDEKKYLAEYLEQGCETIWKKAAQELYRICMEDSGEWYASVLQGNEDFKCGRNTTIFVEKYFGEAFVRGSMSELGIKLKIYSCSLQISRKLYEEQRTPESAREYSISCDNVGSIYKRQGKLAEALEKYEEGLSISRKLYEEQQTPESARDYSISCNNVGDIYAMQERILEALTKYGESLSISRKLYEEQQTPESAYNYSIICNDVGYFYYKQGNYSQELLAKAQELFEESMSISRKLYEEQRTPKNARVYGIISAHVGYIYEKQGWLAEAQEKYEEDLSISRKLYEEQQTPESARDYSISCNNVGCIYEKQGWLAEAQEKFEEAHSISRKLYEEQQTPESAQCYSRCCNNVGRIYEKHERLAEAQEKYEEELSIRRKVYEKLRTPESAQDYTDICKRVGGIYEAQERLAEAMEKYEEMLSISRNQHEVQQTTESASNYSFTCILVGSIYEKHEWLAEAQEKYEESLSISRKLYEEQRTPKSKWDYIISCDNVGRIYEKQEKFAKAQEKYEEMLSISRKLYEEEQTLDNAREYSVNCNNVGRIYKKQGKLPEALEKYEEFLSISRKLYEQQRTLESAREHSTNCETVGVIYEKQGKLAEAQEKYEESLSISRKLYEEQQTPESAREHSINCGYVGVIYEKQGKLAEAQEKYEESLSISRKLYEEQQTPDSAREHNINCETVGRIYEKQGRLAEALEKYEEALSIRRKLYEEQQAPESAHEYIIRCDNVGRIYEMQGRLAEALKKYEEGLSVSRKLYEEQQTPESARDYSINCNNVGGIYKKQGRLAEALEKYKEFLSISRKLYEEQQTPESARNYSISCSKVGGIYEQQGKLHEALEKYEEGLSVIRKLYEEQQTSQSEQDYDFLCNCVKRIHRKVGFKAGVSADKLISIFNNAAKKKYTGISRFIPQLYSLSSLKDKQIRNILKYCARGLAMEEIIVFCGTNISKNNGKKGFVFTDKGIYADDSINKNVKGEKTALPILYSDIEKCEYKEQLPGHVICILTNGRYLYLYTDIYSQFFCEVINQIAGLMS